MVLPWVIDVHGVKVEVIHGTGLSGLTNVYVRNFCLESYI
jgi:hypothetical protein